MTARPHEHRAVFPSPREESVRDHRTPLLSVRGKQVFHRLLVLLPTYLTSSQTSHTSVFPPPLLFSICDALQQENGGEAEERQASVLPSVLGKLRDWRLLDPDYRCSRGGIHKLALALAGITDEVVTPPSSDPNRTSRFRLRMRWIHSDPPSSSPNRQPFPSINSSLSPSLSPSPSRSKVHYVNVHALLDLHKRRSDAERVYETCQGGRVATPDSEDACAVVSRRHPSVSGFRSGCLACRHPRLSDSSAPPSPRKAFVEQRTPSSDVTLSDTDIITRISSLTSRKPGVRPPTTLKKTRREKHTSLQSTPLGAHVDENEPPLVARTGIQQGKGKSTGVSLTRQRTLTHAPRISNTTPSREVATPNVTSLQRRREPPSLPNRTREGDKHTVRHRVVASVDLGLHMGPIHSPNPAPRASPIDLHPHSPTTTTRAQTRTQRFSDVHTYTPGNAHGLGLGSVAAKAPKLSSNTVESRSSKGLPSWARSHPDHHPTTTRTSSVLQRADALSPPPAKARLENPYSSMLSRLSSPSIPFTVLGPSGMNHRDRRLVPSQTHKQMLSANLVPSSPLLYARKWQV